MGISIASALAVALTVHSVSSFSLLSPRALTAPPSLRRAAGGVCTQKDGWAMQERKTPSKMRQGEGESGWMERLGKGGGVKGAGLAAAAVCASVSAEPRVGIYKVWLPSWYKPGRVWATPTPQP